MNVLRLAWQNISGHMFRSLVVGICALLVAAFAPSIAVMAVALFALGVVLWEMLTGRRPFLGASAIETLNAILMNFAAMGWEPFFRKLPQLYRTQDRSRRLQLLPLFREINRLINSLTLQERLSLWQNTGAYVRRNAWQLAFYLDARRNFRQGLRPGGGTTPLLAFYDRCLNRLTDHPAGRLAAACLTSLWFRLTCLYVKLVRR